jgi:flagellar assembly protein FliH
LSDRRKRLKPGEAWVPLDVSLLENYGEEQSRRTDRTRPDFGLFTVLYEPPPFREEDRFRELYDFDADSAGATAPDVPTGNAVPPAGGTPAPDPGQKPAEPVKDKGFEAGFEKGRKEGYDQGFAQARKKGYDEGFKKGEAEAAKAVEDRSRAILSSLGNTLSTVEDLWRTLVKENESQILSLICRIAEKVVLATVELDQDLVRRSVLEALETLPEPREIVLNISPEDYEYIETVKEEFFEEVKTLSQITVVANASVKRGGCAVETPDARIRTDVESRLEAVFSSVLGRSEP